MDAFAKFAEAPIFLDEFLIHEGCGDHGDFFGDVHAVLDEIVNAFKRKPDSDSKSHDPDELDQLVEHLASAERERNELEAQRRELEAKLQAVGHKEHELRGKLKRALGMAVGDSKKQQKQRR